jgi:hypothetical protein
MIALKSIREQKSGVSYVRDALKKILQKQDLFGPSFSIIAQRSLLCFNFKNPAADEKSIQEGCSKVIEAATGARVPHEKAVEYFARLFLELDTLPLVHKLNLETVIRKDLAEIESLLSHYYSLDVIKKYIKEAFTPRNHSERTVLDFFNRTVKKKEQILHHFFSGLEDIAIGKAKIESDYAIKYDTETLRGIQYHNDFPYTDLMLDDGFGYKIDYEKLDYRRINPLRNKRQYFKRSTDISRGLTPKLEKEFQGAFTRKRAIKLLDLMVAKVANLPILKVRKDIFVELKLLYKTRKWYGFYGLALPQIEGIFSEMSIILDPQKKSKGSLTNKVQQVRPFYELSDYVFDYYEYYLPEERNKFSHIGTMENIHLKSSLLLIDLYSILRIFESLDAPLIELNNMTNEGVGAFDDIGKFSRFFNLLKKISPAHLLEIQPNLDNLMYNILPYSLDIIEFVKLLDEDFKRAASLFAKNLTLMLHIQASPHFNIFEVTHKFLHEHMSHLERALKNDMNVIFEKELQLLLDVSLFVNEFTKRFPNQNIHIKEAVREFETANQKTLSIVNILRKRIDIQLPDYVYLFAKEWKHTQLLKKLK